MSDLVPIIALSIPIVAIVMVNWRSVQMRKLALLDKRGTGLNGQALQRIQKLEERVAVLERIITDRPNDLLDEINRLG